MKISKATKEMIKSYLRGFIVAVAALYASGVKDWKMLLMAGLSAVIAPAIRAIDSKDPAFGMVADIAKKEIDKLAKADRKKSA